MVDQCFFFVEVGFMDGEVSFDCGDLYFEFVDLGVVLGVVGCFVFQCGEFGVFVEQVFVGFVDQCWCCVLVESNFGVGCVEDVNCFVWQLLVVDIVM